MEPNASHNVEERNKAVFLAPGEEGLHTEKDGVEQPELSLYLLRYRGAKHMEEIFDNQLIIEFLSIIIVFVAFINYESVCCFRISTPKE